MSYYRVKLLKLRSLQHRISKPAVRLVLIWLGLLFAMFAAPRWIDQYLTNHGKVIAGVNYYSFPIQIQLGATSKQVPPFGTYRWDLWDSGEVELIATRMSGEEVGRRSWSLTTLATTYLDLWSPNDAVTSCAAQVDLTDFLYSGGERQTSLSQIADINPAARIAYAYSTPPVFQVVLDQIPVLPESTGTNVSVAGVFLTPCNSAFDSEQLNGIADYWLGYDSELAAGIYQRELSDNLSNLSYGTL